RSSASIASLAMLLLLSLRFLAVQVRDMRLHAVKPRFPQCSVLGDPAFRRAQRGRCHLTAPHATNLLGANEPALFQHVEVLQERRHRHGEGPSKLAHGGCPPAQARYDSAPSRVGKSMEDTVEVHGLVSHTTNYSGKTVNVNIT